MTTTPVYLDHNATTPVDDRVLAAMMPYFSGEFGNASSPHRYGRQARSAIDTARQQVAATVGAHPTEVVFFSGGSEANNQFIKGALPRYKAGDAVAISAIEHPCVRNAALQLARQGWQVHDLEVDASGCVTPESMQTVLEAAEQHLKLFSVMLANNETGVVQDIARLASLAQRSGGWFHTDAVQALGKLPLSFRDLNRAGVHAMTLSAHKVYGPKGAAALVLDKRVELEPLVAGGGQERGIHSGTENVAAIVGFGAACEIVVAELLADSSRLQRLRDQLEDQLCLLGAVVFSRPTERLPGTSFFAFPGLDGDTLVGKLDRYGFAVASGAACSSIGPGVSHVLMAMQIAPDQARGAVRVSMGKKTSQEDVARFLQVLGTTVSELRNLTAVAA